jgi:NADH dehydrogenase [ubiquinone] 1 alpha subcomplex assembly factor 7
VTTPDEPAPLGRVAPPGEVTPLLDELRLLIEAEGPIGVDRYMQLCLGHPRHGYYITRDPFGAASDFVTAPEVSQMFGELIGLWCVETWQRLGSPRPFHLVELGPGRGTLMADALRAARLVPSFGAAARVHLVETSPVLRSRQREALAASGATVRWHDDFAGLPTDAPMLVVANEFFDALPVRQFQKAADGWHERLVGIGPDGRLALGLAAQAVAGVSPGSASGVGDVLEVADIGAQVMRDLAGRLAGQGGAALVIDYGHVRGGTGDTLQAVRRHAFVDVLDAPGEADLTVHVDFEALAGQAARAGALVFPPMEQGSFLTALGIEARAATLARAGAADVDAALARLVGREPPGMGALFKVLAIAGPSCPTLAVFGAPLAATHAATLASRHPVAE